jgi:hypothetical protein
MPWFRVNITIWGISLDKIKCGRLARKLAFVLLDVLPFK